MELAKKENQKITIFSEFTKVILRYPYLFAQVILGTVLSQIFGLVIPIYLKTLFNILSVHQITPTTISSLYYIVGIIAILMLCKWLFSRILMSSLTSFESYGMRDLVLSSFEYLIFHSSHFFNTQFAGTLTRRISKYSSSFETLVDSVVMNFLPTGVFVIGAIIILFNRNHVLGLGLLVGVILFMSIQFYTARVRRPLSTLQAELDSKMGGGIADSIGNFSGVNLFSGEKFEINRVFELVSDWSKAQLRSWHFSENMWTIQSLLIVSVNITFFFIAVYFWSQGKLTIGDFILIQTYLLGTFDLLSNITAQLRRSYQAFADAQEMLQILNTPHDIQDIPNAKDFVISESEIVCKDVSFHFDVSPPILQSFNITIKPGQKVALVGPSGAGKSTLTKLLLRLYDVTEGSINIDGQDIKTVTQESLRNAIGFVPQEPVLFHRTLMENIRYGKRDATDEEVYSAAKKAHCHEFISKLSNGYETLVGERGVKLSGGERQRVAIARAILKNAPLLILDEATSSLDSESESYIQESLAVLMEGKTVVVIAHRLSTIMKMDRILVLENGAIEADGTHTQLLEQDGLYQKLWSIQAGGFMGDDGEGE